MKRAEQVTFGGSALDRAGLLRGDADKLAQVYRDPLATCVLLWRGKLLVEGEALDRLVRLPMTHKILEQGAGGVIEQPIFLGKSEDGSPLFAMDISGWAAEGLDLSGVGDFVDRSEQQHPDLPEGYVFAELRRIMPRLDLDQQTIPPEVLDDLCVTRDDFLSALKRIQPSAMREVMVQMPNVSWSDIGGVGDAIDKLKEGVELPLKSPDAFRRLGIRPAKGFLLYGPPGTGKTLLAKAVAKEAEANFISMKSSDLLSKWYGESEQQIARMFQRARAVAPCVIFIDEIDSLVPARGSGQGEPQVTGRVVNTILAEMDGLEELQSIVVIGATNRPALMDPALLRPGRFDELVYVGTPDLAGREHILRIHTDKMPLADDVNLAAIAAHTDRFTGADLEDVVRRAGLGALRRVGGEVVEVAAIDFEEALKDSRATVTPRMEAEYRAMRGELKKRAVEVNPIGLFDPDVLKPEKAKKHDD